MHRLASHDKGRDLSTGAVRASEARREQILDLFSARVMGSRAQPAEPWRTRCPCVGADRSRTASGADELRWDGHHGEAPAVQAVNFGLACREPQGGGRVPTIISGKLIGAPTEVSNAGLPNRRDAHNCGASILTGLISTSEFTKVWLSPDGELISAPSDRDMTDRTSTCPRSL